MSESASDGPPRRGLRGRRAPRGSWRRWLGGIVWTLVGLIALTLAARLAWGWYADRSLREAIEALRAAGVPVRLEDFQPAAVPDEQNAAPLLRACFQRIDPVRGDQADAVLALEGLDDPAAIRRRAAEVDAALADLEPVFELVEQAADRPRCVWPVRLVHPVIDVDYTDLKPLRQLARLLRVRAIRLAQRGAGESAVRAIEQQRFLARCAAREGGSLVSLLVAESIETTAVLTLEDVLPLLRVDPPQQGAGDVPRARLEALMRGLLDERWLDRTWRRAMAFERMMLIDSVRALRNGSLGTSGPVARVGPSATGWLFEPMFKLDVVWAFGMYSRLADAGTRQSWAEALAAAPAYPTFSNPFQRFAHVLSSLFYPAHDRLLRVHFRARTLRRLAAVAIALRLAELDHGRRPDALDALVPAYLSELPVDPFADPPRPLRYNPDASPAVLYSVNLDGRDDGGRFGLRDDGSVDRDALDLVWFLDGRRSHGPQASSPAAHAPPPASTQTADDHANVEHQRR